ncbi:putative polyprotein [Cucumis melo var. makuwa]|uniref:Polyprotein n=1 Tax=Cucumis melo var. makuwa TaxID=1194695 RepID=A0A5D3BXU0_CUCMM|nr:putative polyprotein [Cucumis melo var. makuwa]TYK03808.1 putative polyprotein [Cucumis melo var. makuwa]
MQTRQSVLSVVCQGGRSIKTQQVKTVEWLPSRCGPIVPRFTRMFKNLENARNLRWHMMDRKVDGIMRHPADTLSWRLIDHMWPTFGSGPRNFRLGPKQPGYDINTYLASLIDDLKILWEEGVRADYFNQTTNAFGEEDILTRALGGKDHPGIVCGVGEYVTKKKGENVNDFKDLSNDLESQKDIKDVVELNEEIKVNIAKDDEQVEGVTLEKMKVETPCKLAFETKDYVVAWGTLFDSNVEGDNVKVAVDTVIDYEEFTKDMTTFAPTPIQNAPVALRFLLRMVEHMGYLYTCMESSRTLNLYKFVDAGSISCESSKAERAELLIAQLLGTDYDQLLLIPYNSEYVDNLKSSHLYVYLYCSKQPGVVECGYYVMWFMRDIILSTSTSIIHIMKDSLRAYTQDDIDCIRSEWAEFVRKHIHFA